MKTSSMTVVGTGPLRALMIPGGPGLPAETMRSYAEAFGTDLTTLLIDPPGSGKTTLDWTEGNPFLPETVADFYGTQAEYLGFTPDVVMGASFGGLVAMNLAARHPGLVSRLVLISPVMLGVEESTSVADVREALLRRHADQPWYSAARVIFDNWTELTLASDDPQELTWMNRIITPLYLSQSDDPEVLTSAQSAASSFEFNLGAMKEWESGLHQHVDARQSAAAIACPTMIVSGLHDWLAGPHASSLIQDAIRDSELLVLDDCGHFPDLEGGQRFRSVVRDFYVS